MMRRPSFNLDFPPLFRPIRSMAARHILGGRVVTPESSRLVSPESVAVPSYQQRLLVSLWEEGRRQANPIPGMIVLLLVDVMVLMVNPAAWPPGLFLPMILSLWSVWLGATMGRRWGDRLTGAGTEAQSFLAPATRTLRYRAWSWQGLAWAHALWILSVLPAFGGIMLQRFQAVAKGPLPAFPWAGALVYPVALTLAFLLSFRGFMTATGEGGYRRAFWASAGLAALLVLLLEGLPRSLAMQPLDSPVWRLGLPFSGPPAGWWSALSVSLLLALAWRVHRGGLRVYDLKDAVGRPLSDGGGLGWTARIAPISLGTSTRVWLLVFVIGLAVMPAILAGGRSLEVRIQEARAAFAPGGTNRTLAITRQTGGAFTGSSLIQGDLAYLGMTNGIGVMDISDPGLPRLAGWSEPGARIDKLIPVRAGLVYAAGRDQPLPRELFPIDLRSPLLPRRMPQAEDDLFLRGLVVDRGHRYGYGENPHRVYRLDDRHPLSLRAAENREIGTQIVGLVADRAFGRDSGMGRLVVATASGQLLTIDLAGDGDMLGASPPIEMPEGAQVLAVQAGLVYLLVGDDSLRVHRLELTEPKPRISDQLATLSLRRVAAKGKPMLGVCRGVIRGGQLLFVRPASRVMTLIDIAEPSRPWIVAEQGQHPWSTGFDWSESGIISAFSSDGLTDSIVTWHLLRLNPSGALEELSRLNRPEYLLLDKSDSGVWVKARHRAAQRIEMVGEAAPAVWEKRPPYSDWSHPSIFTPRDDGSSMWIRGSRQIIANSLALGLSDVGGGATRWLGGDQTRGWRFPQIQVASAKQLVVSHERGVAVIDISKPAQERVLLDWQDRAEAPATSSRYLDGSRYWAGVYGDWLLALSRDVVLYRWRLDRLDLPPERLEIPMPKPDEGESDPSAIGSGLQRSLTRAFHVGGRLLVVERSRQGDPSEVSDQSVRILDLSALPELRLQNCIEPCLAEMARPDPGRSPEPGASALDDFAPEDVDLVRADDDSILFVGQYGPLVWARPALGSDQGGIYSLRDNPLFWQGERWGGYSVAAVIDAVAINATEIAVTDSFGGLNFIAPYDLPQRLWDTIWGRAVVQE